jgi:hypothetical protein
LFVFQATLFCTGGPTALWFAPYAPAGYWELALAWTLPGSRKKLEARENAWLRIGSPQLHALTVRLSLAVSKGLAHPIKIVGRFQLPDLKQKQ